MTTILFHQDCRGPFIKDIGLPDYLGDCLRQYSCFNEDKVYVLTDHVNLEALEKYPQVIPVALEDCYSDKVGHLTSLFGHPEKDFWTVSLVRFVYITNFMKHMGLQHVYHFENDILIYSDLSKYHETFKQLYRNLAITPGGPGKCMTGFMYISDYHSLSHMTDFFVNVLANLSEFEIRGRYSCDMVHEMSLMSAYRQESGPYCLAYLPILPFGEFSENFDKFNSIFDPATFGQFVGGTRTEGPGIKPSDHYIGRLLTANPKYGVKWVTEARGKVPYFHYADSLVKINNLHIHSKNLNSYVSWR